MVKTTRKTLDDAIARNAGAILSLPTAEGPCHRKSRLLAASDEGIWLESKAEDAYLLHALIAQGTPVGVAFKTATQKAIFTTVPLRIESSYSLSGQVRVEAALLRFPESLSIVQRRANYRVRIPQDEEVQMRVWPIPEYAVLCDRPPASQEARCRLLDLSINGMAFLCERELFEGQRLRVAIKYRHIDVLTEGRVKNVRSQAGDLLRAGARFEKLHSDLEGWQALSSLTTIVGLLQRMLLAKHAECWRGRT
jgi:c-di-GMP-binding flagellar brake protein YcgR